MNKYHYLLNTMYLQVCMTLSRKKAVHILSVTEDKIIPLKEIQLPETPLHMVRAVFLFA